MLFVPAARAIGTGDLRIVTTHEPYVPAKSRSRATAREVERLVTRASYFAACHSTGQHSGYGLEKCYGPRGAETAEWPRKREYVWDSMGKRGSPGIRQALARSDPGVRARLKAVREKSELVEQVRQWSLWRHLDPRPLTAEDVAQRPRDSGPYGEPLLFGALLTRSLCRDFVSRMRKGTQEQATRYDALNALWYFMRRSVADCNLLLYILSYVLWREAGWALRSDPVLGRVADELQDYAARHFGLLRLHAGEEEDVPSEHLRYVGHDPKDFLEQGEATFGLEVLSAVDPAGPVNRRSAIL